MKEKESKSKILIDELFSPVSHLDDPARLCVLLLGVTSSAIKEKPDDLKEFALDYFKRYSQDEAGGEFIFLVIFIIIQ